MADDLDLAFTANNSQRLACALVLDCSGSMQQDNHINQLNEGVKILEQELKRLDGAIAAQERLIGYQQTWRGWMTLPWRRTMQWIGQWR